MKLGRIGDCNKNEKHGFVIAYLIEILGSYQFERGESRNNFEFWYVFHMI